MTVDIVVAETAEELRSHREAWLALAAQSVERNVFYEPGVFLPAWTYLGADKAWKVVLIYRGDILIGLFPINMRSSAGGLVLEMVRHSHSFLHAPLVHQAHAPAAVDGWLRWCRERSGAGLVICTGIDIDGPAAAALKAGLERAGAACLERTPFTRPFLVKEDLEGNYPRTVLGAKMGPDLKRRRRRLEESGAVVVKEVGAGEDIAPTSAAFLALEKAGWKGENGSALACKPAHAGFFGAMAHALHRDGLIKIHSLLYDERPIAMVVALMVASPTVGAFSFKTAFDDSEALRAVGAGNMLAAEAPPLLQESYPDLSWNDSCARGANKVIAKLFPRRRSFATLVFGVPGMKGRVTFETARLGLEARTMWKKLAVPFGRPAAQASKASSSAAS